MKKMKKIIALLLAVLMMLCMLTACNKSDDDDDEGGKKKKTEATENVKPSESQNTNQGGNQNTNQGGNQNTNQGGTQNKDEGVAVGTILDAPEVIFDDVEGSLEMKFSVDGEPGAGFALVQESNDLYVLYLYEGDEGVIYEITSAGYTLYTKEASDTKFVKDTSVTQAELQEQVEGAMEQLNSFVAVSESLGDVKYQKADSSKALTIKRDYYRYEVLQNGEKVGALCIDKATGLLLRTETAEGEIYIDVTEIKISNAKLPQYK